MGQLEPGGSFTGMGGGAGGFRHCAHCGGAKGGGHMPLQSVHGVRVALLPLGKGETLFWCYVLIYSFWTFSNLNLINSSIPREVLPSHLLQNLS